MFNPADLFILYMWALNTGPWPSLSRSLLVTNRYAWIISCSRVSTRSFRGRSLSRGSLKAISQKPLPLSHLELYIMFVMYTK